MTDRARAGFFGLVLCLLGVGAGALSACAPAPGSAAPAGSVGDMRAAIVIDRTIQTFVRAFRIAVLSAVTREGVSITCDDIPANYQLEPMSPSLIPVAQPQQIAWEGSTDAAQIGPIAVPAERELLIAAEGLTRNDQGTFVIARGCADGVSFAGGSTQELRIDVRATSGTGCDTITDCEPGLECYQSTELPGGYCAKVGCTTDQDCLPGSRCTADTFGAGVCARICTSQTDCEPSQSQDCVTRIGPDGNCGRSVCVYPLWAKNNEC